MSRMPSIRITRVPGAAVIRGNDGVVLSEDGTNMLPCQAVLGVAVNEEQRRAGAGVAEVYADVSQGDTAVFPRVPGDQGGGSCRDGGCEEC